MVPEVVPPDPSEIVKTYRFIGPDFLAGGSGRLEDTGDVCQDVFVHHGGTQQMGVHLPQHGLDLPRWCLAHCFP